MTSIADRAAELAEQAPAFSSGQLERLRVLLATASHNPGTLSNAAAAASTTRETSPRATPNGRPSNDS